MQEVINAMETIKINTASGHDGIPAKIFALCAEDIAPVLTLLINALFKNGEIPDILKTTMILPIY